MPASHTQTVRDADIVRLILKERPNATDEEIAVETHLKVEDVTQIKKFLSTFGGDVDKIFGVLNKVQEDIDNRIGRRKN